MRSMSSSSGAAAGEGSASKRSYATGGGGEGISAPRPRPSALRRGVDIGGSVVRAVQLRRPARRAARAGFAALQELGREREVARGAARADVVEQHRLPVARRFAEAHV